MAPPRVLFLLPELHHPPARHLLPRRGRCDVVVGSSFGGAVCVELLRRGDWGGPSVLLAPAAALYARMRGAAEPVLPEGARAIIVHGARDAVVPPADSERLARGSGAATRLLTVDDTHGLRTLIAEGADPSLRQLVVDAAALHARGKL
eukprot:TRINITY_DN10364_c0_g1_i4.p3 TRINITY_DN10364_c0_g1~~TRINITY_DN10364_c0_g1_i4.p3  ORF type:complete len:165 (+),score=23.48 TRINITY_DN10364_c0_g1_i4:54-497(+)